MYPFLFISFIFYNFYNILEKKSLIKLYLIFYRISKIYSYNQKKQTMSFFLFKNKVFVLHLFFNIFYNFSFFLFLLTSYYWLGFIFILKGIAKVFIESFNEELKFELWDLDSIVSIILFLMAFYFSIN
jgi:hypothetical protein